MRVESRRNRVWLCREQVLLAWAGQSGRSNRLLFELLLGRDLLTLLMDFPVKRGYLILHLGEDVLVRMTFARMVVLHRV